MLDTLWSFLKSYWGRLVSVSAALLAIYFGALKLSQVTPWVKTFLSTNIQIGKGSQDPPMVDSATAYLVTLGLFALVVFLALSILFAISAWRSKQAHSAVSGTSNLMLDSGSGQDLSEQMAVLRENLDRMIDNAYEIFDKIYPEGEEPAFVFSRVEVNVKIDQYGNATIERFFELKTTDRPLHYLTYEMSADDDPADFLTDLEFIVKERTKGFEVLPLQKSNSLRKKEVAIFFLPKVDPGEESPRQIEISFKWKGMFKKLLERNRDRWQTTLRGQGSVPKFTVNFFFHPDLGQIRVRLISRKPKGEIQRNLAEWQGWNGWNFDFVNAPANESKWNFELSKKT